MKLLALEGDQERRRSDAMGRKIPECGSDLRVAISYGVQGPAAEAGSLRGCEADGISESFMQ